MLSLRHLPLRYRLPLINFTLNRLGRLRSADWAKAEGEAPLTHGPLTVSGFFNESQGIGEAGRLSLRAFQAAGFSVTAHDLRPCFKQILNRKAALPHKNGVWFIHANAPEVLVALMAHPPEQWAHTYRIAYWAWETSKAPSSWVFVADYLHEIWVPSLFVRDAVALTFHEAGRADLLARLRIMPHPVTNPSLGRPEQTDDATCEVLCLFDTKSSAARKNPWAVISAWRAAFPQASVHTRLTLKISDPESDPVTARRLKTEMADRPDIILVSTHFSETDMRAFMAGFDILISLHRAEGFGLSLAEAMAAGVVVIATDWSGNLDFMTHDNSTLIPAILVAVDDPDGTYTGLSHDPQQRWAEPDVEAASIALRDLVASPDRRLALAKAARCAIKGMTAAWHQDVLIGLPFNAWLGPNRHALEMRPAQSAQSG